STARYAGTLVFFARTDPSTRGPRGISAFILDAEHVRVTRDEEKLGLNSSATNDLVVEGARVGRDRLLHEEGKGFRVAMATLGGRRGRRSRSSAGTATRRSSRSSATTGTRRSQRSTRGRARSSGS